MTKKRWQYSTEFKADKALSALKGYDATEVCKPTMLFT